MEYLVHDLVLAFKTPYHGYLDWCQVRENIQWKFLQNI